MLNVVGTNNFNLFERLINIIFLNCDNYSSSSSIYWINNDKIILLKIEIPFQTFTSTKLHSDFQRNENVYVSYS